MNVQKLLLISLVAFCISCNENLHEITDSTFQASEKSGEEKAIEALNNFLENLTSNPQTRSTVTQAQITNVKRTSTSSYSGSVMTKSENIGLPLFEFTLQTEDNKSGFALVTDDPKINEVIAYTTCGSISDTLYNEGLAIYFREVAAISEYITTQRDNVTRADYWQPGWEDVLFNGSGSKDYSTQEFVRVLTDWETKTYATPYSWIYYGPIDNIKISEAYLSTEWDQVAPYNCKVPYYHNGTSNRVRVGCLPVAVGQIMSYHKFPSSYNWTQLTAQSKISSTHIAANEVGRLLYNVALAAGTQYNTSKNVGSTSTANNISALNKLGYTATEIYIGTAGGSSKLIKEEIDKYKRPVLYSAQSDVSGHAWVIDAIMTIERWKYMSSFSYSYQAEVLYRYRDSGNLIHCNWGWGGKSNGWFYNFKVPHEEHGIIYFNSSKRLYTNIKPK